MKAFKKWFDKIVCDLNERCDPTDETVGCDVCEEFREQGWRAALENILHQMNKNKLMDNGELRTYIQTELED